MINSKDVDFIKVVGKIKDEDVKMLKTKGGFYLFIGKAGKGRSEEVLTGCSHPAIGFYHLSKQYPGFEQILEKSESEALPQVVDISDKLNENIKNKNIEVFTLSKFNDITVSVIEDGKEIASLSLVKKDNCNELTDYSFSNIDKDIREELSINLVNIIKSI